VEPGFLRGPLPSSPVGATIRWSFVDTDLDNPDTAVIGTTPESWSRRDRIGLGLSFRPVASYVLRGEYEFRTEGGGNFVDTADVYRERAGGRGGGDSETILGAWMRDRGNRREVVVATKVAGTMGEGPNDAGLSRRHIMDAVDASLRRLQTDYIDLYQAHSDDDSTPLDETLRAFDDLVAVGKVRYLGASNYSAWRTMKALGISDANGWARFVSQQPVYNLVRREVYEGELQALCLEEGLGAIPYSTLGGGFFTGKYRRGEPLPDTPRAQSVQNRYMHERGWAVLDVLLEVAENQGATPAQVALAWLMARPGVTAPIASATSPEQARELLAATELRLSPEALERLSMAGEERR